jgi:hypothetical protein
MIIQILQVGQNSHTVSLMDKGQASRDKMQEKGIWVYQDTKKEDVFLPGNRIFDLSRIFTDGWTLPAAGTSS